MHGSARENADIRMQRTPFAFSNSAFCILALPRAAQSSAALIYSPPDGRRFESSPAANHGLARSACGSPTGSSGGSPTRSRWRWRPSRSSSSPALAAAARVLRHAQWFGAGFWDLVTFTMQMSMIIVTGYAVATAPPVYAVIRRMASDAEDGPRRRGVRRPVLDAGVARVVELQPDLQRAARARGRASRARRRLSRDRRGRVSRRRQRLGARPVVVGGADHGGAGVAARCDREDQRRHSARPDARAVAEPADRRRCSSSSRWRSRTTRRRRRRRRAAMADMGVDLRAGDAATSASARRPASGSNTARC